MITREKALKLLDQYIKNPNLKKHLLAAEALMKALAKKFGEDVEIWGLTGLIHDIDWEQTIENPTQHSIIGAEILEKEGFPEEVVNAVKVHNDLHNLEPKTNLEKALYSCEEITGLIVATALVMPNKKLTEVTPEKVLSKFKEKSFARGVNRKMILKAEEMLDLKLEELTKIALEAMQGISEELGL
jgi:putative nucleotidyltransferase with HDIG domain